jgi:hypothetical protein
MARQYDVILQDISRNRAAFAERVAEIRADQRLTAEGKREMITEAYTAAMRQHNGLKSELAAAREAALVTARGRAFASRDVSPAGEANYRAAIAQAREASRDGRQMQALVDQAVATRDSTLLRALAFIGHETGNGGLLRVVAQHEGTVADLLDVEARFGNAQSPDMRLANSMATTAPSRPPEVSQMAAIAAMSH